MLTRTGRQGELIDLSAEKTYKLDFKKRRYAQKLGLLGDLKQAGQEMAQTLMSSPALQQAMKEFEKHQESFEGSSLRTITTLETVTGSAPRAGGPGEDASAGETPSLGGMLKGLRGKFGRRGSKKGDGGESTAPGPGGRRMAFRSTNEIRTLSSEVAAGDVAIPGGFQQKTRRR